MNIVLRKRNSTSIVIEIMNVIIDKNDMLRIIQIQLLYFLLIYFHAVSNRTFLLKLSLYQITIFNLSFRCTTVVHNAAGYS